MTSYLTIASRNSELNRIIGRPHGAPDLAFFLFFPFIFFPPVKDPTERSHSACRRAGHIAYVSKTTRSFLLYVIGYGGWSKHPQYL